MLLDRGWGKPVQPIEERAALDGAAGLSNAELEAIVLAERS
jgi:hypothetical protein